MVGRSFGILFLLVLSSLPVGHAQAPEWTEWITDPTGDPAIEVRGMDGEDTPTPAPFLDPRFDIVSLDTRMEGEWLHVRFATAGDQDLPDDLDYSSNVWFVVQTDAGGSSINIRASEDGFELWDGEALPAEDWEVADGALPWAYDLKFRWSKVSPGDPAQGIHLYDPTLYTFSGYAGTVDRATGGALAFGPNGTVLGPATQLEDAVLVTSEGPDFAGGTSVAIEGDGTVHTAYYVYRDDRGDATGLYHAVTGLEGLEWAPERVGDFDGFTDGSEGVETRDAQTRTEIAVASDGTIHILYNRCPAKGCENPWTYATDSLGAWATIPVPVEGTDGGQRFRGDIVAEDGRVILAVPLSSDGLALQEFKGGEFSHLATFADARFPDMDIHDGQVHLAFFHPEGSPNGQTDEGSLMYVAESDDWEPISVVPTVRDQSGFWDTEVDGSFAFAVDPAGVPAFVWDQTHRSQDPDVPERGFGRFIDGRLAAEPAPLEPSHGNPQLAIRMDFDDDGVAHIGSGYGGTDSYMRRAADGSWGKMDVPRFDVWDMAVNGDGQAVFGYTEPHGGTTVAVSFVLGSPDEVPEGAFVDSQSGTSSFSRSMPGLVILAAFRVMLPLYFAGFLFAAGAVAGVVSISHRSEQPE